MLVQGSSMLRVFLLFFAFIASASAFAAANSGDLAEGQEVFSPTVKPSQAKGGSAGGVSPLALFARQSCETGYKYCSGAGCCTKLSKCCGNSCTPIGGECCSNGLSCDTGDKCCGSGCMDGITSQCCGDGTYCPMKQGSCHKDNGRWKCRSFGSGSSRDAAGYNGPDAKVLGGILLTGFGAVNLLY
ncbi:hypothetical protein AJ80_04858 [Polytolypa hystricis UAMH7299]|uniref:Granulins domain-containing protein n=1 Tax=Polytolypa hystricis (strain UAMH7299) TaxID=1447883 RepID=A0A2B7Y961_POLH7|nr:hypothetical protein AJ80_04858 [Polytolypa hystricis UAMH7299]